MIRSRRCVFVSHCILAQAVRANGLVKYFPAIVRPVVQFCLDKDINIVQMPCPESCCAAGGLRRDPHGKKWYEARGLRQVCASIARSQVAYMKELVSADVEVLAIIGMEFSPACAVSYLNQGRRLVKDQGIYVEELRRELDAAALDIPFLGVNQRALKKLDRELRSLVDEEPPLPGAVQLSVQAT